VTRFNRQIRIWGERVQRTVASQSFELQAPEQGRAFEARYLLRAGAQNVNHASAPRLDTEAISYSALDPRVRALYSGAWAASLALAAVVAAVGERPETEA
jgi:hypothetical protein